jgi:hypothetical protein
MCHPDGILLIFKFRMCDGKSRRDDMLVEKQSEINENPGGMACKILFLTRHPLPICHPDGILDRDDHDCYRYGIPPGFSTVVDGILLPICRPDGILDRHGWELFK